MDKGERVVEIGINSNNNCGQDVKEILTNIKDAGFENVMLALKIGKAEDSLRLATELGVQGQGKRVVYGNP